MINPWLSQCYEEIPRLPHSKLTLLMNFNSWEEGGIFCMFAALIIKIYNFWCRTTQVDKITIINCIWQYISIEGTPSGVKNCTLLKTQQGVLSAYLHLMNNSNTTFSISKVSTAAKRRGLKNMSELLADQYCHLWMTFNIGDNTFHSVLLPAAHSSC